jgi:hypothetical protein
VSVQVGVSVQVCDASRTEQVGASRFVCVTCAGSVSQCNCVSAGCRVNIASRCLKASCASRAKLCVSASRCKLCVGVIGPSCVPVSSVVSEQVGAGLVSLQSGANCVSVQVACDCWLCDSARCV